MKVYSINYDLKKPGMDYQDLYDAIKQYNWWHYLESTWLVHTNDSASDIFKRLKPHIDDNDSILIIEAGKDKAGWLPEEAWDWINKKL
jgi:hypothetical protein